MLIEHFKSQYDYNLHLPSTHPYQRVVIIQATYPEAAYPDRELIYDKHLQEYGKLVLTHTEDIDDQSLKPYYNTFFVLNYTITALPPSTVTNYTEPADSYTKIRFTLRTQMVPCAYCKLINHDIEICPLVPRCFQCHTDKFNDPQQHNYLSCPYNDIEEKMDAIQLLNPATIQRALSTRHALKQIPQAVLLHPNFPKESLTEAQYKKYITSAEKAIAKQKSISETKENVTKTTRRKGPSQNYNSQNTSSIPKQYNKNTNSFTV
ncbi:hypothetical protein B5S30_g4475 [[Candida] boidinii]|nr:hypothetical protein B5S30_g4475 [[Candida] boidinii]